MSGFRMGLIIGGAIGYTLGAKAGHERYEQIIATYHQLSRSEPAQQLGTEVREMANRAGQRLETKAEEGVARVSERVRGEGNGGTARTTSSG